MTVAAAAKKSLFMEPDLAGKPAGDGKSAPQKPYEITIAPGDHGFLLAARGSQG